jgi:hypothetical protein
MYLIDGVLACKWANCLLCGKSLTMPEGMIKPTA